MEKAAFPILEFDNSPRAILEPSERVRPEDVPEHCVICFFAEVVNEIAENHRARIAANSLSEIGRHPLYEINVEGKRLAFFHPGIGAPLAVGLMEEMIARGCRKIVACGGCGVLDKEIAVGHLLIPVSAIRDEGTSYHYQAPSREVEMDPKAVSAIETVLGSHGLEYLRVKTWTTDAMYRETPEKAAAYRAEGCLTVEMETAAFIAAAKFRGVDFGQILYGGDAVMADSWDGRTWTSRADIRRNLFWLAAEAAFAL
ncbi:MAG: nucleoside phosphorylase [Anaerolineaceae bacterium]|jgi:uridine phosphorylase|nr:nucleoside phosphorylase [Anaerolineaceae bacterium]